MPGTAWRALIAAGLALGCAQAGWEETKAGPFVVYCDAGGAEARRVLNHLEQLRGALAQVLGRPEPNSIWPITVVVSKPAKGAAPPPALIFSRQGWIGAWPANGLPPRAWLRQVALLLIDGTLAGRMPPGYEEAVADLYSTLDVAATRVTLGTPLPAAERTPLWAKLHMLATSPAYSGKFRVLLSNLANGAGESDAYRNAFEKRPEELDGETTAPLATIAISGRPIDPGRQFRLLPAAPAAVRLLPADLAFTRTAYQAVLNQDAALEAHAGLGLVYLAEGARDDARREFELSGAAGARAAFELARLGAPPERVQPLIESALKANPRWGEPLHWMATREPGPARKAYWLEKATALEPRRTAWWRELAEVQEAAGKLAEAAKAWRGAVRAAASPAERDELRRLQLAAADKRQEQALQARRQAQDAERAATEKLKQEMLDRIRAAEAKASAQGGPPVKAEEWWSGPRGTVVAGTLERFDCLRPRPRLVLRVAGQPLQLHLSDPKKLALVGGREISLACGPQRPARRVSVEYLPQPDAKLGTAGEAIVLEFLK